VGRYKGFAGVEGANVQETDLEFRNGVQDPLVAVLDVVRQTMKYHAEGGVRRPTLDAPSPQWPIKRDLPSTLSRLSQLFDLTTFEEAILILLVGMELEADFHDLVRAACGMPPVEASSLTDNRWVSPTFSLCLAALPDPYWAALMPTSALRHWRLIEVGAGNTLVHSPLRIDERILHYLTGVNIPDERLLRMVDRMPAMEPTTPTEARLAADILNSLRHTDDVETRLPVIQLCGQEASAKRVAVAAACAMAGWPLYALLAETLPTDAAELETLRLLWEREVLLANVALLIDADLLDTHSSPDGVRADALTQLLERLDAVVFLCVPERRSPLHRPVATFDVPRPTVGEQRALWQSALGGAAQRHDDRIIVLTAQFDLGSKAIRDAAQAGLAQSTGTGEELWDACWHACRVQARPRLDDLAQRIETHASWDDLITPSGQQQVLRAIVAQVRQRERVYGTWGMGGRGGRGLGITALFTGTSGTGKTTAAEVLAGELKLDLYRVDLSAAVSKYIGETEKNLRRIFDAAESGGVVLLFDEADALFGKRSEVKDSHDRHANIEVSYLLQRMESYRGLAILTTNLRGSLDPAFLRRLRFIVQFPFPDAELRAAIWRRAFPVGAPTENLDPVKLARLNVAGGNIRTIALNAAFLAAEAKEPIRMSHLLAAVRIEYAKLDKTLTDSETDGWL
jgi:hypothetical protein